jgi:hypothetical protein
MTLLQRSVFLAFAILLACGTLAACSAQPSFLPEEFQSQPDSIECYEDPNGDDVACVYQGPGGLFGRWSQQGGEEWYFRCPSTPNWQLSSVQQKAEQAQSLADSLLKSGSTIDPPTGLQARADCIESFWNVADSLTSVVVLEEPTWRYADECVTSVDNATLHFPSEEGLSLPTGNSLSEGDTLAVVSPEGGCAGHRAWTPDGSALAAATYDEEFVPEGVPPGAALRLEVYDKSAGLAYRMKPQWKSCGEIGVPICAETTMASGAFFQAEALK